MKKSIPKILIIMLIMIININAVVWAGGGLMTSFFGTEPELKIENGTEIGDMVSRTLAAIQYIGFALAIAMIVYVGVKYVMSSANDKAELKNGTIRLVIGVMIVAGAVGLFPAFWQLFSSVNGDKK